MTAASHVSASASTSYQRIQNEKGRRQSIDNGIAEYLRSGEAFEFTVDGKDYTIKWEHPNQKYVCCDVDENIVDNNVQINTGLTVEGFIEVSGLPDSGGQALYIGDSPKENGEVSFIWGDRYLDNPAKQSKSETRNLRSLLSGKGPSKSQREATKEPTAKKAHCSEMPSDRDLNDYISLVKENNSDFGTECFYGDDGNFNNIAFAFYKYDSDHTGVLDAGNTAIPEEVAALLFDSGDEFFTPTELKGALLVPDFSITIGEDGTLTVAISASPSMPSAEDLEDYINAVQDHTGKPLDTTYFYDEEGELTNIAFVFYKYDLDETGVLDAGNPDIPDDVKAKLFSDDVTMYSPGMLAGALKMLNASISVGDDGSITVSLGSDMPSDDEVLTYIEQAFENLEPEDGVYQLLYDQEGAPTDLAKVFYKYDSSDPNGLLDAEDDIPEGLRERLFSDPSVTYAPGELLVTLAKIALDSYPA